MLVQLGCEKNTVDGERLLGELTSGGYEIFTCTPPHLIEHENDLSFWGLDGSEREQIELMVVNACSFIGPARRETLKALEAAIEMKNEGLVEKVALSGCFTPLLGKEVNDDLRGSLDYLISPGDFESALEIVSGEEPFFRPPARVLRPGPRVLSRSNGTAFLKIAEGCNKTCAFCTIPSFKGLLASKPLDVVVEEVISLIEVGVKEVVFVSQDTASWGTDIGSNLAALLAEVSRTIEDGDFPECRLRVHYLYPTQVTDELIDVFESSPLLVPYFDIPVQHASPGVLRAMRRPPLPDKMIDLVARLRSRFEECAVRSTVMTGHPGEGEAEFKELLEFLEEVEFDRLGVFAYSPEPGTPAFDLEHSADAVAREAIVFEKQAAISKRRLEMRVDNEYRVLMDAPNYGRSPLEAPDVDGVIVVDGIPGEWCNVKITGTDEHDLFAERVPQSALNSRNAPITTGAPSGN